LYVKEQRWSNDNHCWNNIKIIASSLFLDIQTFYVVSTVVIIASSLFLDIQSLYVVSTVVSIASQW
jgi:hypothetical protein